jgi:Integrase core domain
MSFPATVCNQATVGVTLRPNLPDRHSGDAQSYSSRTGQTSGLPSWNKTSHDGKGRAYENIFVERLWRSVKYEEVYLKSYHSVPDAMQGLEQYCQFCNHQRLHQSLNYRPPVTHLNSASADGDRVGLKRWHRMRYEVTPPIPLLCDKPDQSY